MSNYLQIMDFSGEKKELPIDLDDLSNISNIGIQVISGDEVCIVTYKDGSQERFDSSDTRIEDFYSKSYILYSDELNINLFDEFNKRTNSNDMEVGDIDE